MRKRDTADAPGGGHSVVGACLTAWQGLIKGVCRLQASRQGTGVPFMQLLGRGSEAVPALACL